MACFESKYAEELVKNAAYIRTPGKTIFAADAYPSPQVKFYRDGLFRSRQVFPFLKGIILREETLYHEIVDGKPIFDLMKENGVLLGIRVGTDGEAATTQCLDSLGSRCAKYYEAGARFAKLHAPLPDDEASESSIHEDLARYASICQENGLVPIVSPKFFGDGSYYNDMRSAASEKVRAACYKALSAHNVMLEGIVMKPKPIKNTTSVPVKKELEGIVMKPKPIKNTTPVPVKKEWPSSKL